MAQVLNAATCFVLLSIVVISHSKPNPSEIDPRCENMYSKKYEVITFNNEQFSNFYTEINERKAELNLQQLYGIGKKYDFHKSLFKVQTESEAEFLDIVKRQGLKLNGPDCSN